MSVYPFYSNLSSHLSSPLTNGTLTTLSGYRRSGRTTILRSLSSSLSVPLLTPSTLLNFTVPPENTGGCILLLDDVGEHVRSITYNRSTSSVPASERVKVVARIKELREGGWRLLLTTEEGKLDLRIGEEERKTDGRRDGARL